MEPSQSNHSTKRRVFYGEATDIGFFSGQKKKRLEISNKTKKFAIALFEPEEVDRREKNKKWVKLEPVGKEEIYVDIASLAKRLRISEEKIIHLAKADSSAERREKKPRFLETEIQKCVDEYFSIRKFVEHVFQKNLSCKEIEAFIFQDLGMIKNPQVEKIWSHCITQNRLFPNLDQNWSTFFNDLFLIDELTYQASLNVQKEFSQNLLFFEEKVASEKLQMAMFQVLEKITHPEIQKLRDELLEENKKFPKNCQMHLDRFLKKLFNIDESYFPGKEKPLWEKDSMAGENVDEIEIQLNELSKMIRF